MKNKKVKWWSEEYGFFGNFYLEGDNSISDFLFDKTMTLKDRTVMEVEGLINILDLKKKGKILDIPCGYGRHSIELAERGFHIIGSDLNAVHLKKARKNAKKRNVKVKFVKENMIDIKYNAEFDILINMFFSFGIFGNDQKNFRVLKKFFKALKPGGKFLMHTTANPPDIISGLRTGKSLRNLASGSKLRTNSYYNPKTKRLEGSWIIEKKDGLKIKKDYSVRIYTKEEFLKICKKAGFKNFSIYGDWMKNPYRNDSKQMIIVAKK